MTEASSSSEPERPGLESFKSRANKGPQLVERYRFRQVIESTCFEGGNGIFRAPVSGNHRHRQIGMMPGHMLEHCEPIAVRQSHVRQAKLVRVLTQKCDRLLRASRAMRIETHARQGHSKKLSYVGFVIDDENLVSSHIFLRAPPCTRP